MGFKERQLKLMEEGLVDWAKKNPGKTALGALGGLGAAGLGLYAMTHGEDGQQELPSEANHGSSGDNGSSGGNNQSNELKQVTKKEPISMQAHYALNKHYGHNAYNYDKDIDHNEHLHKKALRDFVNGHGGVNHSLNTLLNKYASIKEPYQTLDDVIKERDRVDDLVDNLRQSRADDTQAMQSKLSDEYARIKDSDKPVDILRKEEIIKKLTNNPIKLPQEYLSPSSRSAELTEKILNWNSPEHLKRIQDQLDQQQKIADEIDRRYGGQQANAYIEKINSLDNKAEELKNNYDKNLANDNKKIIRAFNQGSAALDMATKPWLKLP